MTVLVELKPFRTCLGRPFKKPKGQLEFTFNIQVLGRENNMVAVSKYYQIVYTLNMEQIKNQTDPSNLAETVKDVNNLEDPTVKNNIQKPNRILLITSLLTVVLVVLAVTSFIFYRNFTLKKNSQTKTNVITPAPKSNNQRSQPDQTKKWYFEKKTSSGVETVFTLPDLYNNQIVNWNNHLFYGSGDYTSNVQVFSFNLKTGETKAIYDQESRNDLGQGRNNRYVADMQVINNTLFFSVGGYLTSGATFYLSLPPTSQPQKLADSANGKIEFMKNHYWIISGEGDACWGVAHYSLLDLTSKRVTEIAGSTSGCFEGEEYVDIDKRDRMILAFHTAGTGEGGEDGNGVYQYVLAVPLSNPKTKEGIIAKQNMPSGITSISYLEDKDQLVLYGKESFVFDFASQTLTKTSAPSSPTQSPVQQSSEKTFSDKIKELNLPQEYEFVLK